MSVRDICRKCNFRANFSLLAQGFDVRALIPQGKLTGSPNYSGFSNNLMIPINCESLKAIGEMACITPARSSLGQTLKYILSSKLSWRGSEIISDLFWVVV